MRAVAATTSEGPFPLAVAADDVVAVVDVAEVLAVAVVFAADAAVAADDDMVAAAAAAAIVVVVVVIVDVVAAAAVGVGDADGTMELAYLEHLAAVAAASSYGKLFATFPWVGKVALPGVAIFDDVTAAVQLGLVT